MTYWDNRPGSAYFNLNQICNARANATLPHHIVGDGKQIFTPIRHDTIQLLTRIARENGWLLGAIRNTGLEVVRYDCILIPLDFPQWPPYHVKDFKAEDVVLLLRGIPHADFFKEISARKITSWENLLGKPKEENMPDEVVQGVIGSYVPPTPDPKDGTIVLEFTVKAATEIRGRLQGYDGPTPRALVDALNDALATVPSDSATQVGCCGGHCGDCGCSS